MKRMVPAGALQTLLLATFAASSLAAQVVPMKEDKPGLLKRAKVSPAAATATALARVPKGSLRESAIEEEHGKLVYSFDIKVAGRSGVEEVQVDALTGVVVSVVHESAAEESRELKGEKATTSQPSPAKSKGTKPPMR